jgi:hypothetical protein
MGGTGKTTTLKEFIASAADRVDVTAPTGVAALNVGGLTVHRFCGMLLGPQRGQSNEEYFTQLESDGRRSVLAGFNRVRRCRVLVIDEISMLPGRQLEFIEFLFRRLRGRDEAFGGCQVIVTGDFLQLPPVRIGEAEPYNWAFRSPAWEAAGFRSFVLDVVRRQDEPEFVQALGEFRVGRVWGPSARLLQSRVKHFPPTVMPRLFTHNVQVDRWNDFQLSELEGEETVLEARMSGPEHQREFLVKSLLTPAVLRLKRGALVMFTVNKNEPGCREPLFVNGQIGTIQRIGEEEVWVKVKSGAVIVVERFTWRYDSRDPESATFSQFPLRLTPRKPRVLATVALSAFRQPSPEFVPAVRVRVLGCHRWRWHELPLPELAGRA